MRQLNSKASSPDPLQSAISHHRARNTAQSDLIIGSTLIGTRCEFFCGQANVDFKPTVEIRKRSFAAKGL